MRRVSHSWNVTKSSSPSLPSKGKTIDGEICRSLGLKETSLQQEDWFVICKAVDDKIKNARNKWVGNLFIEMQFGYLERKR